jgi:hypothetical protein
MILEIFSGSGVWLSERVFVQLVQGPGFQPSTTEGREKGREIGRKEKVNTTSGTCSTTKKMI